MKKYVVFDEVFDIITTGGFERLTEQQLIDSYFRLSGRDAQIIRIFDSEKEAIDCLEALELCHAKEINYYQGLIHIAFVQSAVSNGGEIVEYGEVIQSRVGM